MFRRVLIALAAASGVLVLAALPAAAHIEVDPSSATAGSSTLLTFRVPNEMDNADTVGLKIKMPTDHPLASVSVQPKAGWTITTKTAKPSKPLSGDNGPVDTIVTEVDWSGGKIPPGQFDTFELSIDPLPDVAAALVFPTIQTYKDAAGKTSTVDWIQTSTPGAAEPEHPAPTLQLVSAGSTTTEAPSEADATTATTAPTVTAVPTSSSSDKASSTSVLVAIILGALALVAGLVAIGMNISKKRGPEITNFTAGSEGEAGPESPKGNPPTSRPDQSRSGSGRAKLSSWPSGSRTWK